MSSTGQPRFGFLVEFSYGPELTETEVQQLDDEWFSEVLEANGLSFGGGGPNAHEWDGFITRRDGGSADEEARAIVERWLRQSQDVIEYRVGPLEDADSPDAGRKSVRG